MFPRPELLTRNAPRYTPPGIWYWAASAAVAGARLALTLAEEQLSEGIGALPEIELALGAGVVEVIKPLSIVARLAKLSSKTNTPATTLWPRIAARTDVILAVAEQCKRIFLQVAKAAVREAGLEPDALIVGPLKGRCAATAEVERAW